MFGKKKTQDAQGNPIYKAKYVGGHKMFPKSRDVEITLLADKIKISRINFDIKYSTITNVENVDEKKIELKRIVLLGIGLSVIALNLGMYLGVPAVVIVGIKRRIF